MRHKRFYTLVGLFVLGALSLMILGAVFFYEEYTQAKKQTFVMFFKGSLNGLKATTPVTYRGVKIGEVKLIEITESKTGKVQIPVYVEFFVEQTLGFTKNPINILINNGYIADVSKPNFLTGTADIELVKAAPQPVQFKQTYFRGYRIFPTRNTVENSVTIDDALKSANIMFNNITTLIRSKRVIATIDATKDMAESTKSMADSAKITADNLDKFITNLDQYAPSVASSLNQSLLKISKAAESTQNLTDYLARHPESLLRGKQ